MLDGADDELNRLIEEASQDTSLGGWTDRQAERPPSFPRLEHHGYFRFRADVFWNGHLGLSVLEGNDLRTTAIPPPLSANDINSSGVNPWFPDGDTEDRRTLASANIRFRYQPTFHISPSMRIHGTFDVLDNLVLGSTPDFAGNLGRADVPLVAFSSTQAPPTAGFNGFKDSVAVKEAYAEWQPAFLLRAGRMSSHWGLGILANGGGDVDDDYGDYADRVLLGLKLYGVYVFAAYDFVYSGFTTDSHNELFGQPKDLGTGDDVQQAVLTVFQRPMSADEKARREVDYREKFEPIFDWGVYGVFRSQTLGYSAFEYELWLEDGGYTGNNYDQVVLQERQAWAVVPDVWFRYMQRFDYFSGLRIEMEAVAVFGEVGHAVDDNTAETQSREIRQIGAALEAEYDWKELTVGIHTGFASGDSAEGFGLREGDSVIEGPDGSPNKLVSAFKFDRGYHVDLLLFRELIGTITNAYYVRPYVAYDLFDSVEDALGARLDIVYGHSLAPKATPGDDPRLGLEFDLSLFYEEKGRFNLEFETGLLIPFDGFAKIHQGTTYKPQDVAFTFQARMALQF